MIDNIVLDVAIGLIFIFTIYSLLATIISEMVAHVFAYRGRMLERGLEQMLDGENHSFYWWQKIGNYLLAFWGEGKLTKSNKPLSDRAVTYSREGKAFMKNTVLYKKTRLFAAQVTSHAFYTRSTEKSVFSKKPAYLSSATFSNILIDLLCPSASTQPTGLHEINHAIDKHRVAGRPIPSDTEKILRIFIRQANGDMQAFRSLIENWYSDTMGRVSGWYKRQTFWILLIIGLILAIGFNVSTIGIVRKLSNDKDLREAMIKSATDYVKANQANLGALPKDPNPAVDEKTNEKQDINKGIEQIKKIYSENIEAQNTSLGLGWGDFGYRTDSLAWLKKRNSLSKRVQKLEMQNNTNPAYQAQLIAAKHHLEIFDCNPIQPRGFGRAFCTIVSFENIFGFIITALAISLGAPFWFDLLNKFINLRSAGKKPEETAQLNNKNGQNLPRSNSFG